MLRGIWGFRRNANPYSGVMEGDAVRWHPQINWKGMASPERTSVKGGCYVYGYSIPQIKLVNWPPNLQPKEPK
jgi:hypothetical protein